MSINVTNNASVQFTSVTEGARSPQLAFAMLQMELARANKDSAMSGIQEIEAQQAKKREVADMLNLAREMQEQKLTGPATQESYDNTIKLCEDYRDRGWATLPDIENNVMSRFNLKGAPYGSISYAKQVWNDDIDKLKKLKELNACLDKLGISMPTDKDSDKNKAQWDRVINQLQTHMDTLGSDIQTQMVQLQDMMGQYNSYMQGANSAISTSNQTLMSLARGS